MSNVTTQSEEHLDCFQQDMVTCNTCCSWFYSCSRPPLIF
jgi:hypothetical protein